MSTARRPAPGIHQPAWIPSRWGHAGRSPGRADGLCRCCRSGCPKDPRALRRERTAHAGTEVADDRGAQGHLGQIVPCGSDQVYARPLGRSDDVPDRQAATATGQRLDGARAVSVPHPFASELAHRSGNSSTLRFGIEWVEPTGSERIRWVQSCKDGTLTLDFARGEDARSNYRCLVRSNAQPDSVAARHVFGEINYDRSRGSISIRYFSDVFGDPSRGTVRSDR
jgi:hypothetical protein